MSETTDTPADPDMSDRAREGIERAEGGDAGGVEQVDEAASVNAEAVGAVEQETADGPPGRGVSR